MPDSEQTSEIETPKYYSYSPQKDITTYELAYIMPMFLLCDDKGRWSEVVIGNLMECVQRHFSEIPSGATSFWARIP